MRIDLDLGQTQRIIDCCQRNGLERAQTAYVLATARWETAHTMEPVREAYWLSEGWRSRNLRYYPWYGRGFVQLTWQRNYLRAGKELNRDLTTDPDAVMEPEIAAEILVRGMMGGWFTGKALPQYVGKGRRDLLGARKVVNGMDRAEEIAAIAEDYEKALEDAPQSAPKAPAQPDPAEQPQGLWAGFLALLRVWLRM